MDSNTIKMTREEVLKGLQEVISEKELTPICEQNAKFYIGMIFINAAIKELRKNS